MLSESLYDGKKVSGVHMMNAIGPQVNPSAVNPNYFQERHGKANPTDPASSLPLSTADTGLESLGNWSLEDLNPSMDLKFPLTGPEKADFEGSTVRFDPDLKAPDKLSTSEAIDNIIEDIGLDPKATKKVLGVVGSIVKGEAKIEKSWKF